MAQKATKKLTLADISPKWAEILKNCGMEGLCQHESAMALHSACIVGEAWGGGLNDMNGDFAHKYQYHESEGGCDRCRTLSDLFYDATLSKDEEMLKDAETSFVNHWNEKHVKSAH